MQGARTKWSFHAFETDRCRSNTVEKGPAPGDACSRYPRLLRLRVYFSFPSMCRRASSRVGDLRRFLLLFIVVAAKVCAQGEPNSALAQVEGDVRDAQEHPIAAAVVSLEATDSKVVAKTDGDGRFRFTAVRPGKYMLRVNAEGHEEKSKGPLVLGPNDRETCSFVLTAKVPNSATDAANAVQFSDEPAFSVAAVTDSTEYGGHGSARFMHNRDTLSKETISLEEQPAETSHATAGSLAEREGEIRAALAKEDSADLHVQLADIEEREGRSLEAVHDYQRAVEMQPSEAHQFVWGAELLLHHAYEPAIIVFTQGRKLYPQSTRMLLGLAVATYANGTREAAERLFVEACDLDPSNPTPYLFLGRFQALENIDVTAWVERMSRFVRLHPESAMAHYLYAMALERQAEKEGDLKAVESHLKTAIDLDPRFGEAYLQLGILCADRRNFPDAITMLQRAVEFMPAPDQAHYRLAQVYRQTGETEKARQETAQFKQISEQKDKETERERHEIQQFVYTLRNQTSPPAPSNQH